MNKQKALKIINNITEAIKKNELEEARIYVDTWVIGALIRIETKMNGGYVYENKTYEQLFKDFISHVFCRNIDPAIKIYAIASVFTFEIRDMIIRLFECMFDLQYRIDASHKVGYIAWNDKWMSDQTRFEIIRRWSESEREHD